MIDINKEKKSWISLIISDWLLDAQGSSADYPSDKEEKEDLKEATYSGHPQGNNCSGMLPVLSSLTNMCFFFIRSLNK